jgi:protein AaeX
MKGEIDIGGVFIPCQLLIAVAAFFATALVKRVFRWVKLYRFVWHAGLFDAALFTIAAWSIAIVTSNITP